MYLKKEPRKERLYLSIVRNYWDPKNKVSRTETIQTLGYKDVLEKDFDDPIAHFEKVAAQMTADYEKKTKPVSIQIDPNETLEPGTNLSKNFGYAAFSQIYHELGIDRFFNGRQRGLNIEFNLNSVMKLLVFGRAMFPGSKKYTFEKKELLFEKTDFELHDVYRSLTYMDRFRDELQKWLFQKVSALYGRDTSVVYYDVTNYYFEIDRNDEDTLAEDGTVIETGFRKKGVSKEHRPDPIVQMGLFMDSNNLPICYHLFDGNTNDTLTLRPSLKDARMKYGLGRVIVVADKGINSGDNIYYILSGKNGYVLSKSIRGGSKELKEYALNQNGYTPYNEHYKIKSKRTSRDIKVTTADGKDKFDYTVAEKLVVLYSEKYDKRAKADRAAAVAKARDMVAHPSKYNQATSYGAAKYVKNLSFSKETGEILDSQLCFDEALLEEEEKLDGYYAILSSEMDLSAERIVELYRGLWHIEESFKVTKSDLDARPAFVSRKDHIQAHFLTCFVTLLLSRILERKLNYQYPISAILSSLQESKYTLVEQNYYELNYYDEVLQAIGQAIGIPFNWKYRTLQEIKKMLAATKKI